MKQSDAELVAAFQQGSEEAFEEIYRRYAPRLVVYIWRRCGHWHWAEEIVQEAMLKAARYIPHGTMYDLNGYLILCARQVWWLRAEQERRKPQPDTFDPWGAYSGHVGFVEDLAIERETAREIIDLLNMLPGDERDVALLKVLYDYDLQSAAQLLGRSRSNASALWRRTTRKLAGWKGTKSGREALEQALILAAQPEAVAIEDQCRVPGCSRPRHAHERCQYHADALLVRRRQIAEGIKARKAHI